MSMEKLPSQADLIRALEQGADPNEHVLLPISQFNAMKRMFDQLAPTMEKNVPPVTRETLFITPVVIAVAYNYNIFLDALIAKGADPSIPLHPFATPPLQIAISAQNFDMVSKLISAGADCNQLSYMGNAVSVAVISWEGRQKALNEQLKAGDNKHILLSLDDFVKSEFSHHPSNKDATSYKILQLILDSGGRVDIKNHNGNEPIVSALIAQNYIAFSMLLPYYKDVNKLSYTIDDMKIPLSFLVASSGKAELLRYLLEHGADRSIRLSNGDALIDWAEDEDVKQVIKEFDDRVVAKDSNSQHKSNNIQSNHEGWIRVVSDGEIEFMIPREMEIQGGPYKEIVQQFTKKIVRIEPGEKITIQQAGLNAGQKEAFNFYMRLSYVCTKGIKGGSWGLNDKLSLSDSELDEIDEMCHKQIEQSFLLARMRIGAMSSKIVRWDKIEVVPFANGTALKKSYCRQMNSNPLVEVISFDIGDDDRVHNFTFSYRKSEEDKWLPLWKEIVKTIKFVR